MTDKRFFKLLIAVIVVGIMITLAHVVYICYAYQNSSIIQFVARELWL